MNDNNTDVINTLEDVQSFIRDYLNTIALHPDYSDASRVVAVLESAARHLKQLN